MGLETGTYISDLVSTNPVAADPKSQGDDHLRLIKATVKATFPNISGAVTPTHTELNYMVGATTNPAMKDGSNLTTPTLGDSSTKIATTAFVAGTAFASTLPAQTGNAGKFVTTDGTTASWAVSGIGSVGATVTTDTTLTSSSAGYQFVQMAALGKSVTLPDSTTLTVGGPRYIIDNTKGGYPCGIRDNTGTLIMGVAAGGEALVSLKDNSTAAGSWSVTGSNLEPGLITIDSTFSSTYASTVLAPFVALDNNTSIHFVKLAAGGFAGIVVDNLGKVVSTPVTIDANSNAVPATAFKVSSTSAIVCYSDSSGTGSQAVVLTLTGSSPSYSLSIGSPLTVTAFGAEDAYWYSENFVADPRVAQLSTGLYVYPVLNAGALSVKAISVSGTTVTAGSAASIIGSNAKSASVYPLTSTTALVLYKSGAAAPYANNAVVISVSGTTCTVNTPVALTGCAGSTTNAPSSVLVSSTKAIVSDDNNASGATVSSLSISGTTIAAGTALLVEASASVLMTYTSSSATRYNPHLWTLTTGSTNTVGLWYFDSSGISRVVVLSETSGTITAGTILYTSISRASSGSNGFGAILPQGTNEFCSLMQELSTTAGVGLRLATHKISGTTISQGQTKALTQIAPVVPSSVFSSRISQGDYAVVSGASDGSPAIEVIRSNGDAVNYRGAILTPALLAPGYPVQTASSNRIVILSPARYGTTVGASTYQLRLLNVEIAA